MTWWFDIGLYIAQNPIVLAPVIIWSMAWKGVSLWKAGTNKQIVWFILLFILNTLGILPIIYLAFFQKKKQ